MTEFRAVAARTETPPRHLVPDAPPVLVGLSAPLDRVRRDVLRAALLDTPVLVSGEPGSGKSLIARAIHEHGDRANQLCAVVACQAFPETLLEVELFGCAKGSIVGASYDRRGVLEMAHGGTVILENIEAVSARTQASIERFLETGRVRAVGTIGPGSAVNTRLVATSAKPARSGAAVDRQHPALWTRLAGLALHVPSLRERRADIPLLCHFFASRGDDGVQRAVFSADAIRALSAYSWPGNVSQLRSVVERLVACAGTGRIEAQDLPVGIRPRPQAARDTKERRASVGEELFARVKSTGDSFWAAVYPLFMTREITRADLRDLITRALDAARGDAEALPRVLNMPDADKTKFLRFLRKYGCEPARPDLFSK